MTQHLLSKAVLLESVSCTFGTPSKIVKAVDNISLEIKEGEFFSLLGPSGSGKTTCLRLIGGFERPSSGSIRLFGTDASRLPPFLRELNTVFQDYALFPHMTVAENVAYALMVRGVNKIERTKRALEMLESVKLAGFGSRRPAQLSGGQRQRIAIARAVLKDPAILILDEATSALDSESERLVQDALDQLMKGRTSIVIAHRLSTVRNADRILVLDKGIVLESGTHDELIADVNGLYHSLSRLQLTNA